MTEELMKKLEELSKDKDFLEGLSKQTSESAIKEYLKSKNVEISDEDFAEIAGYVSKYAKGQLSKEDLAAISGGRNNALVLVGLAAVGAIAIVEVFEKVYNAIVAAHKAKIDAEIDAGIDADMAAFSAEADALRAVNRAAEMQAGIWENH